MGNSQESICFVQLPPHILLGLEEEIYAPLWLGARDNQCYELMSGGGSQMASLIIVALYSLAIN